MSWLLDEAQGSERIAEYEARLNAEQAAVRTADGGVLHARREWLKSAITNLVTA